MVLSSPRYKRKVIRLSRNKCMSKFLVVQGRKYEISEPPVADMIIWENMHKWTWLRVIIAWIITFGICFCSYLLVGIAQFQKEKIFSNKNFGQDCSVTYSNSELANWNTVLEVNSDYYNCYCEYHRYDLSIMRGDCYNWAVGYTTYLAIPFLISLGIVLYNLIISRFFRLLSKF